MKRLLNIACFVVVAVVAAVLSCFDAAVRHLQANENRHDQPEAR